MLSGGVTSTAMALGAPELAMSVKGISLQNVDPRPEPAWGLLNATESFGSAAHVWTYADLVIALEDANVNPLVTRHSTPREIAAAVRYRQDLVAVLDSLTSCAFSSYAFTLEDYAEAMHLMTDEPCTPSTLLLAGQRIVNQEREFNRANGFTAADDTLPDPVHGASPFPTAFMRARCVRSSRCWTSTSHCAAGPTRTTGSQCLQSGSMNDILDGDPDRGCVTMRSHRNRMPPAPAR